MYKRNIFNMSNIWWEDMCFYNERAFFSANNTNGIFSMNLATNEIKKCCQFEDELLNGYRLFTSCVRFENKILFAPLYGENLQIYDMDSNIVKKIELCKLQNKNKVAYDTCKFVDCFCYENYVYIIPCSYPAILKYDIKTEEILYLCQWLEELEGIILDRNDLFFRKGHVIKEGCAYIPFCNTNAIMKIDLNNSLINIIHLKEVNSGFSSIQLYNDCFILTARKRYSIFCWEEKTGKIEEININNTIEQNTLGYISSYKYDEKNILLFPSSDLYPAILLNIQNGRKEYLEWMNTQKYGMRKFNYSIPYFFVGCNNKKLYFIDMLLEKLIEYSTSKDMVEKKNMCCYELKIVDDYIKSAKEYFKINACITEGKGMMIWEYMDFIWEINKKETAQFTSNYGTKIYNC